MAKTSQHIVNTLIDAGLRRAFTLPGLGITWSLPAFEERRDEFEIVLTRSEHIASVMAQVTGRLTGRPGVLMGQGPFVSSLGAMGIQEAYFAGSPMFVLTDTSDYAGYGQYGVYQTMTADYGGTDIRNILGSMTKYCCYATEPKEAVYGTQLALKHASLPRQGPAAVIMKTSIVRSEVPEDGPRLYDLKGYLAYTPPRPDPVALRRLVAELDQAQCPVFVAGNGVAIAQQGELLQALAEKLGAAVVTSYNAKGVIDESAVCAAGMLGTWGHATANRVLAAADCVIMLGASMGPDYTRFRDPQLVRPGEQILIQVDIDPRNAGWVYPVDLPITADVTDVLTYLDSAATVKERTAWGQQIRALKDHHGYDELPRYNSAPGSVHHADVVAALQKFLQPEDMLTLDAGANRIWSTHGLRMHTPGRLLTPGGIGGMGWSPPAAAAAKLVYPERRLTALAGDGGFAITMNVIATCVQYGIDVTFMVSNNCGLGMVRDNLGERRIATDFGSIDFATVAEGMGATGLRVDHADGLVDALEQSHTTPGPVVINVTVDPAASYLPAVDSAPL